VNTLPESKIDPDDAARLSGAATGIREVIACE
jgi:hypothetical protein